MLCGLSLGIRLDTYDNIPRPIRLSVLLENLTYPFCKEFLRFRKEDIHHFYVLLNFSNVCIFDNRATMSGEEVFIRGLYELCTGEKKTSIAEKFGRHPSDQTRSFHYFINYLYNRFHHLVDNNLEWWRDTGLLDRSCAALVEKIGKLDDRLFVGFIDCNCLETDRPGGGPCEAGSNARRWNVEVQRAYYNGWKSIHGLKHQTVDNCLGFTMDTYGPVSLRRNDLTLFRDSNERLGNLRNWYIIGDSAYQTAGRCASYNNNQIFNRAMKSTRISIEWNYMSTVTLFPYVGDKRKFKILSTDIVAHIYVVATFLRNCYSFYYGNETMHYFNVILPNTMLECYIKQQVSL